MTFFKQKTRTRFDYSLEFAAKRLPAHPVSRYSTFSKGWKSTRKRAGYVPWPKNNSDDLFPCCRTCQTIDRPASANEPIWRKTANVRWLRAEWKWDFGHLLPAGLMDYGVGVTPPAMPVERDRVFVFKPDLSRGFLDLDLKEHAEAGADQHEAKARVSSYPNFELVAFEGQLLVSVLGDISIAAPRSWWFGDGKEIWQRFTFENPVMPFELSNLVLHDGNIKIENGKVLFMGVEL